VVVATSLVAVVLVASLETLGGSMRTMRETTSQVDAHALAERMMAEVLRLPFEDPDGNTDGLGRELDEPPTPVDRLSFDDLDDYADLTVSPPEERDGTAVPGYDGWSQTWRVRYAADEADGTGTIPVAASDEGIRRVYVEVVSPSGQSTELYALRSKYGPADAVAPFDAERVTAVQATIVVDGAAAVTRSAVPTNLAEAP
ncbi:MAG: hypothetical protein AAF266_15255, partial [Planctomycetota bacterium]